ncbi:MAG TPA: prephenate dehydrogenase/arogenate dehydrogenase family protein [Acidimicrobiales bacterium]|nr:prephenate dehydrogenase/arogenate dehydrogenase family protein [Acidimicrobiales bacterium]
MTSTTEPGTPANVVGIGLIGGSIGMALRERGWKVLGTDADPAVTSKALALGAIDEIGLDPDAVITFVATPVTSIAENARLALDAGCRVVTDAGSVKAPVVDAVGSPRFVGGHPMAGSEQEGVDGADPELFEGAVWVLTPTSDTAGDAYTQVASVVTSFGAEVVAVAPDRHDALVAVVSHVPHLTAATLMGVAEMRAEEHAALLRLAAGGFRDMTRIASGHPAIWQDICRENRGAIIDALDALIEGLVDMRDVVDKGDGPALLDRLERARAARANLPSRVARPSDLAEVRIPVPDRPGVLAEVTTLAAELGVNTADIEIAHSAEGNRGVVIMLVEAANADVFRGGLMARGYRPSVQRLG